MAKRFIKILLTEWTYVIAYQSSEERNRWLPRYLGIYSSPWCYISLGSFSPQQHLQRLQITE